MQQNKPSSAGRLAGQVALITGGNSGIGKATAALFAAEGAQVLITGRRANEGRQTVEEIHSAGGQIEFLQADHTREEDCNRVVEHLINTYGRLDILFNNAGIVVMGTAEDTPESTWQRVMDVNVTAVWRMSRLALPHMRRQGKGVIVNNASDWGLVAGKAAVAYCTSKGAVVQMTKAMALDHAREGIRVNAVCPGDTFVERWAEKGYFESGVPLSYEQANVDSGSALPMGRIGLAHEIAQAVLFLASDASSFVTGTTLLVDGGNTAQ